MLYLGAVGLDKGTIADRLVFLLVEYLQKVTEAV